MHLIEIWGAYFLKNFQKTIDKYIFMYYNTNIIKQRTKYIER